jgi:uncharacterized protein (DUF362 family)
VTASTISPGVRVIAEALRYLHTPVAEVHDLPYCADSLNPYSYWYHAVMSSMSRRTFLLHTGRWLAFAGLAGVAPAVAGCGEEHTATTFGHSPTTTETAAGEGATTHDASSGSTGTTNAADVDLAVVKGDSVEKNVRAALALLGGMERFVVRGGKVVVKPNVLTGRPPEYATTSSPELVQAVIVMCWEAGAKEVVVLDNPTSDARSAFETSGLAQAVAAADARLAYLSGRDYQEYDIPEGKVLEKWEFVTEAMEADTLIDLALPKQHSTSGATMTMKNLMGVMGGRRGSIHTKFAQKIVDVNTLVKPTLSILDGYRVLFRNGPTGGSLEDVRLDKTLVAGLNPVSVDAYGAGFFDKTAADFPWLIEANARGMGEIDPARLRIAEGTA